MREEEVREKRKMRKRMEEWRLQKAKEAGEEGQGREDALSFAVVGVKMPGPRINTCTQGKKGK